MRLYISKKEAHLIQFMAMDEIQRLSELSVHDIAQITFIHDKICALDRLNCRIEDCLMLQKSGYSRKDK